MSRGKSIRKKLNVALLCGGLALSSPAGADTAIRQ